MRPHPQARPTPRPTRLSSRLSSRLLAARLALPLLVLLLLAPLLAGPDPARAFTIHNDTPYFVTGALVSPLWGIPVFSFALDPDQTAHWTAPHTGNEFLVRAVLRRWSNATEEKATLPLTDPDCRVQALIRRGVFRLEKDR